MTVYIALQKDDSRVAEACLNGNLIHIPDERWYENPEPAYQEGSFMAFLVEKYGWESINTITDEPGHKDIEDALRAQKNTEPA
ncbi:hypothetical protein [Archaeoglobus neptunius]|uniref:hypothetical protein n=1 Tax=Archaeoglobus neptunius TaxID=2798580 RepID=UPI001926F8BD|nr:hypothetical protein [Archaeoglobus neptunius]